MGAIRLLEREELLSELTGHASLSRQGSGRLVLVGGEAGAGKTSLVERFRRDLPNDTVVLWGACEAMAAPTPLGPLLDVANELVEDSHDLRGRWIRRGRLFSNVLTSLKSATHPQVVIFEDLHWADEATLDLLRFLARRIGDTSVLFIGTYRDDELGPQHRLKRLLGDVASATAVHRLTVPPLSLTAVRELASELTVDPEELYARTRGNAFFVTEVLATGGERLPEKLGDAVAARVSRLTPAARRALELASVFLRQELDADTLSNLVDDSEAVDECIVRGLLVGQGVALGFRHELVRDAVESALPLGRRRSAHAAVLAHLEGDARTGRRSFGGTERRERLSALAHHATEAGDDQAVLRYATAAGILALKYQANREALIQLRRAARLAELLPVEERAALYQTYAKVLCITGNFAESIEPHGVAADLWRQIGNKARVAETLLMSANSLSFLSRDEDRERALVAVQEIVEDESYEAELRAASSGTVATGRASAAVGQAAADLDLLMWARAKFCLIRGQQAYPDGAAIKVWASKSEVLLRSHESPMAQTVRHGLKALAQVAAGRYGGALRSTDISSAIATQHEIDELIGSGYLNVGFYLCLHQRYRLALRGFELVAELGRNWDAAYLLGMASSHLAHTQMELGKWQVAEQVASNIIEHSPMSTMSRLRSLIVLARLRVRTGGPGAAEYLEEAAKILDKLGRGTAWVKFSCTMIEEALARGEKDTALERARRALEVAGGDMFPELIAELAYWHWRAGAEPVVPANAAGPYVWQLAGRADAAARRWRRLGLPYQQAMALVEIDRPDALRQAHAIFTELGAKPAVSQTAERLARLGVTNLPSRPSSNPAGLTPRERQVLELMRKGLRNTEIARENKVSPRTVDHQVSSVLSKLGASTRTEAVSLADHLGILADKK